MSAAGGAMADAFINLGGNLHQNFNQTTKILSDLAIQKQKLADENMRFWETLKENRRQFDKQQEMDERTQNMNALQMLAQQRAQAIQSFKGQGFKDALYLIMG